MVVKHQSRLAKVNDFMHAVVIGGALVLTALGVFDELFGFGSGEVLAAAAYAIAVASVAYAAALAQPSVAKVKAALHSRRAGVATT